MKKLTVLLIALLSLSFAVDADYFTINEGSKRGKLIKSVTPNYGLITIVEKAKPTDNAVVTGSIVLYGKLTNGAVDLMFIARDVSGNITSGNVTGI